MHLVYVSPSIFSFASKKRFHVGVGTAVAFRKPSVRVCVCVYAFLALLFAGAVGPSQRLLGPSVYEIVNLKSFEESALVRFAELLLRKSVKQRLSKKRLLTTNY